jgi:hypothetical protein
MNSTQFSLITAYDGKKVITIKFSISVSRNLPEDDKPTTIPGRGSYQPTRPTAPPTRRPTFTPITTPRAPYRPQPPPRPPQQPRPTQRPHHNYPDKRVFNGTGVATPTTDKSNFVPTYEGDYDTVTAHRKKFGHSTPAFGGGGKLTTTEMAESVSTSTDLDSSVTEGTASKDGICEGAIDKIALVRGELFVIKGSVS